MKVTRVNKSTQGSAADYLFFCPGCKEHHGVWTTNPNTHNAMWRFNGDLDRPTFNPSIKVWGRRMTEKGQRDFDAWSKSPRGTPVPGGEFETADFVCHSFIVDGMIEFCTDSTHALAGQRVPLPDIES